MTFTDTHTHLYVEHFSEDRNQVIQAAVNAGIKKMVFPAIDSQYIEIQKETIAQFPKHCFAAAGVHPSSVKEDFEKELGIAEKELLTGKYIAVGEIGIDLYWDKTFKEQQIKAFDYQIKLAKKLKLPIIIHVRNAFDEAFEVVQANNDENLTGVFHSFTGTPEQAKQIIDFGGFKIGINGIVTFKNSELSKTVKEIPLEYIVLETDSPYLSPAPKRGKRNESKHLIYIAEKIADIYNTSLKKISDITEQNTRELYNDFKFKS